jgi:hypothetical protein
MTEQDDMMFINSTSPTAMPPTIRKPFLCRTMKLPAFLVSSAAFFAAFAVVRTP